MLMLAKEKQKIDVMILNVYSSNLLSFDLLAQAVALDIISLVVCDEFDELVAKKTLEKGAYLYLKKPFDENFVKYLWQFVLRKRIEKDKAKEGSKIHRDQMKIADISDNDMVGENEVQFEKKKDVSNSEVVRRKDYTEWTDDLHSKFMEAVKQLGEGRCYPKVILYVMNSPGLTRMQVASHLQKCRRNNWRSPKERKHIRRPSGQGSSSVSHEPKSSFRKFGTMPYLQENVPNQIQRGPEFPLPTLNINNIFAQGESSIQQLYRPQLQVQPHYLGIGNPFSSAQNNIGGELKQQHTPFFGMLDSQELQDPIMRNTHYRPNSVLNSEDHHSEKDYNFALNVTKGATYSCSRIVSDTDIGNTTMNDYNLNVNVNNVTTYSSTSMMPNTYVGNVIINELRATNANANFQQYAREQNMSDPRNIVDYLFQNLGPSGANLPNEQDSDFDQVYSDDQNLGPSGANLPNEQGSDFDQVYSDDQNLGPPGANLPNEQGSEFDQVYSDD
ncbi:two-component response regulator ORR21-like [Solanum stenotomum]|uniref:two-component response regulator ORR21-like n=1 Tax=Solanum stenotomum TaxID=172797 RepID=UPI0020D06BBA|nr:two-component response regulator ORR21-like [Solanum stenotomum]